ncbi:MAG: glycerophosphodiester phosphodiesterase [Bacteroidales bacterium]|nr:glycerophosphodiester phosphodiesterase [Bacteroidales bacterium]
MKYIFLFVMGMMAVCALGRTQVVAHRGYWDCEGSAQNSIRALVKADSIGCDAVELDVWLTADSQLVVNHDPSIQGIEIETATMQDLAEVRLKNGEALPRLDAYLDSAMALKIDLVVELKPHSTPEREDLAASEIIRLIGERGLTDRTTYISFSNHAVKYFADCTDNPVYALTSMAPAELIALGATGADFNLSSLRAHPEWVEELKALGLPINVWTVNAPTDLQWCLDQGFDFITTNAPETLLQLLNQ